MKDTYDFTYAQDLRHFIGLLLDDYCPTQLKTVSYTHLDVYKRQVQIHDDQPNLFCHFHVICFYDRSKKVEGE